MHAKHPRRRQGRGRFFRECAPPREGNQLRSSAEGFNGQPEVMNGASDLIGELFGEKGLHARPHRRRHRRAPLSAPLSKSSLWSS